ncbi:putative ion transporter superfamily protein YfcC [Mariniflexile fucanivorans]|uniref:Putative ion transporter superfamily protein YfcC n=1 Tax=Mariniflexile fucanivorans TaxID=264023 RepID=A0A4V2QD56_9FLAO|nr:YfcC family protein [Mariniflexile fucanivorans]TCL63137.1 putative ion transporter superfamily protein YfcC [Mariniflexile fucanivorans]
MKKIKFPTAQTILIIIAGLVAVLTWIIPSGKFDSLAYNKEENTFTRTILEKTETLNATQETLDALDIKIPLEKFTNGDIWKPISIPNTYHKVEAKPQGIVAFIQSPIKGIIEAADIIFLVLFIGGLIGIINFTGAFDAGISWLAETLKGKEFILIVLVTVLIAIGGTTFGLAEETIAFYPILIPIFLAAKYDAMVALACIYLGSSIGTMCSTTNPFSAIIASDAAGINWTTGLTGRFIMLVLGTLICIIYTLRYAQRVKNDPTKSVIYSQKEAIESMFGNSTNSTVKLTIRLRLILFIFAMCFVVMIYGVSQWDWWFLEMTVVFLVGAVLIGFLAKINEYTFIDLFVKGASDLLGVALIIGIARGITVLMDDGQISDTLLYYASNSTNGMNKGVFINAMLYIYGGLSFFIPSSSGMAVLTMPIMSPLADGVGIGRELIVNAYQYGMGLFAFINPTGLILASLAIVKVGYDKWLKFVMPLVIILLIFTMLMMTISVYL